MLTDILALLLLFERRVLDHETHAWVTQFASDEERWPEAHDMFESKRRPHEARRNTG